MKLIWILTSLLLLTACTGDQEWSPPTQQWQELSIKIETRPSPVREGMNEFLVMINHPKVRFLKDLMVHVKTEHSDWAQAMPDGALGVYRRALLVKVPAKEHLQVRLDYQGKQGELEFALVPAAH